MPFLFKICALNYMDIAAQAFPKCKINSQFALVQTSKRYILFLCMLTFKVLISIYMNIKTDKI